VEHLPDVEFTGYTCKDNADGFEIVYGEKILSSARKL
jgi:hypothetical protein